MSGEDGSIPSASDPNRISPTSGGNGFRKKLASSHSVAGSLLIQYWSERFRACDPINSSLRSDAEDMPAFADIKNGDRFALVHEFAFHEHLQ
ncbi:MAG: hypothetical protein A3208_07155 [Candidatus Methanoprimaticola hominis]|nr:MAG: hypothetical protein A3208_07155 [Methanomassiliicoccales archaeon Mx-06]